MKNYKLWWGIGTVIVMGSFLFFRKFKKEMKDLDFSFNFADPDNEFVGS
jgi:uncharacterized membrane protein